MYWLYGALWTIGWLAAGFQVNKATSRKGGDRKQRTLAYVCFAIAALPVLIILAYLLAGLILILSPNPRVNT